MKHCPICRQNFNDDVTTCKFDGNALVELASTGDPLVGTILNGRYKILDTIGRGSMSDVYLAEQIGVARKVAVKILAEDLSRDEACTKRFGQEARIVSALNHPHLVRIFDFDHTASNRLFMVTEYLPGQTLKEFLGCGAMPVPRAVRFACQIADGLDAVHQAGVIHRDLNCKNVMVIDNEQNIKITDFGFAQLRETEAVARLTQIGTVLGNPEYMAPEQIEGRETDERTDIYSLGIVLYEMLCNTVPFTAPTPAAIWMKHLHDEPVPPTKLRPEIGLEFEDIVLRALHKKPELRWQRMKDLAEALGKTENNPGQQSLTGNLNTSRPSNDSAQRPATSDTASAHSTDRIHRPKTLANNEIRVADPPPATVVMESIQTTLNKPESERYGFEPANNTNQTMLLTQALDVPARPRMYWKALGLGAAALLVGVGIVWFGVLSKPLPEDQKTPPAANVDPPVTKEIARGKIVSIAIDAEKSKLVVGERTALHVTTQYSDGSSKILSDDSISWTSTDPAIAAVNSHGEVDARGIGKAELKARYLGLETQPLPVQITASAPSIATEPKLVAVTVKAAKRELTVNDTVNLQATGTYSDKRQLKINAGVRWDSSDPNIATVTESGAVLGKKAGRVELIARYGGIASEPLRLLVKPGSMKSPAIIQQSGKPPATNMVDTSEQARNARTRLDRGEYAEALSELAKANKVDPGNKEVQALILQAKRACNAERTLGRTDLKC
jgi:serine/threonine protein kinase